MSINQFFRRETHRIVDLEKLLPSTPTFASRGEVLPVADLAKLLGATFGPALRMLLRPETFRQWPRLLHEGIDPIVHVLLQANNTAVINRWLKKGAKVVFLSSFPRSGNTWLRFLLSDVLLQMHGIETTTDLPVHPDNLIAEFRTNSIARRLTRCPAWAFATPLAFVKTHDLFARLEQILSGNGRQGAWVRSNGHAPYRDCRVLYVYRSPEDALVSLYHLSNRDIYWRSRALHGIDDFCRMEVLGWVKNMSSYLRAADNGFPVFFVSYERLSERPAIVLSDLLHWLGVKHESQMAHRAVANMQFGKLQAIEIQANKSRSPADAKKRFFRRGGPGSGRAELQESTLQDIYRRTASLMSEANHRQMNQASQHPAPVAEVPKPADTEAPQRNGKPWESEISPPLQ